MGDGVQLQCIHVPADVSAAQRSKALHLTFKSWTAVRKGLAGYQEPAPVLLGTQNLPEFLTPWIGRSSISFELPGRIGSRSDLSLSFNAISLIYKEQDTMSRILVPVDGSEQSIKAAQWAARSGGSVTLIHVHVLDSATTISMAHQSAEQIKAIEDKHAAPLFEKARAAMGDIVPEEEIVVIGDAGQEIVGKAKSGEFDQVIMGSRGRSQLRELLLGSVSEHVLRHAPCPVTIVR
ncbi:MAG: universal stress protein [Wenzhouxiangella sp.]|nr:universal stress protein [Wenzhouxiangella sp.]